MADQEREDPELRARHLAGAKEADAAARRISGDIEVSRKAKAKQEKASAKMRKARAAKYGEDRV